MKTILLTLAVLCASLNAQTPAKTSTPFAQKPATAPTATASAPGQASEAEVRELLTVLNSRQQMKTMIEGMKSQIKQGQIMGFDESLARKKVTLTPEQREKALAQLSAIADEMFNQMPYDEMISATVDVYRKHFTSQDIAGLLAFYKSPTGKKFLAEMPALLQESMQAGGEIMRQRMPVLLESVEKRMDAMVKELESSQTPSPAPKK